MRSIVLGFVACCATVASAAEPNLVDNGSLERGDAHVFTMSGGAVYGPLGDPRRDVASRGFTLHGDQPAASIETRVAGLDARGGRWFRFTFRGLPEANFLADDLHMTASFFGGGGTVSYDAKAKELAPQISTARRDLDVNGVGKSNGAAVWQTYQLDFMLPFPQVDEVRLSVGFAHGAARGSRDASFLVDDLSLVPIPMPAGTSLPTTRPVAIVPTGALLPVGGRWFYAAKDGETSAPKRFDSSNADRLLYHDEAYIAPFAGNTSAWLRAGNMDANGNVVAKDALIENNVTISFDATSIKVTTHGVPNHPTGKYPEDGRGNPSYIQDREASYFLPLTPRENPKRKVTDDHNQNGALHMGPIGIAVNGVVFFNPFDMGNTDATDLMDRCCGHPNQMNQYHYHKYPICVNSPWADTGAAHSPLIGWAFDGYPLYGPYESKDVMAKDVKGEHALNGFNLHYDEARGWHYHVTPGAFPYLIGGFWGVEDARDAQRGPPGGGRGPGGPGRGPPGGPPMMPR